MAKKKWWSLPAADVFSLSTAALRSFGLLSIALIEAAASEPRRANQFQWNGRTGATSEPERELGPE